jgi:hypothetical protein
MRRARGTIAGIVIGVTVCYAFGAAIAWDFNPAHWGIVLRVWCTCWAILWGVSGATIGGDR